jgi:hypothetical protein
MMEKSALPGQGGGFTARPLPFSLSTITYKVAQLERMYTVHTLQLSGHRPDTLPLLFLLYPDVYSVFSAWRDPEKKESIRPTPVALPFNPLKNRILRFFGLF